MRTLCLLFAIVCLPSLASAQELFRSVGERDLMAMKVGERPDATNCGQYFLVENHQGRILFKLDFDREVGFMLKKDKLNIIPDDSKLVPSAELLFKHDVVTKVEDGKYTAEFGGDDIVQVDLRIALVHLLAAGCLKPADK